jgi:hypothetical protein
MLGCQLPGERQQRDGRKEPADGVAGRWATIRAPTTMKALKPRNSRSWVPASCWKVPLATARMSPNTMLMANTASMDQAIRLQRLPTALLASSGALRPLHGRAVFYTSIVPSSLRGSRRISPPGYDACRGGVVGRPTDAEHLINRDHVT